MMLLLVVLSLYLLDNSHLKKYIGYEKVKEYISKDINVFGLGKGFFGDDIFMFYNTEATVNSNIIKEVEYHDGYLVYLSNDLLYSTFIGSVLKVEKYNGLYTIVIATTETNIMISNIKILEVSLYQKIEVDTLIGIVDGFYYYEKV